MTYQVNIHKHNYTLIGPGTYESKLESVNRSKEKQSNMFTTKVLTLVVIVI